MFFCPFFLWLLLSDILINKWGESAAAAAAAAAYDNDRRQL